MPNSIFQEQGKVTLVAWFSDVAAVCVCVLGGWPRVTSLSPLPEFLELLRLEFRLIMFNVKKDMAPVFLCVVKSPK